MQLGPLLDALGDHLEPVGLGEADHGAQHGQALVGGRAVDEALVDLQHVQRQGAQAGERVVAGAEVVERDPHAASGELGQHGSHVVVVVGQGALGDLDGQPVPGAVAPAALDLPEDVGLVELARGHVDRHREAEPVGGGPGGREHLLADLDDQAGLLRERQPAGRRAQGVAVLPPGERLDTDHLEGRGVRHRLEVRDDPAFGDGALEVGVDRGPAVLPLAQPVVEVDHAGVGGPGLDHGEVGVPLELHRAVARRVRDPDGEPGADQQVGGRGEVVAEPAARAPGARRGTSGPAGRRRTRRRRSARRTRRGRALGPGGRRCAPAAGRRRRARAARWCA